MFVDARGVARLPTPDFSSWQSRGLKMWVTGFNKSIQTGFHNHKLADYAAPGYPVRNNSSINTFGKQTSGSFLGLPAIEAPSGNSLLHFEEINPPDQTSGVLTWSAWFEAYSGTTGAMVSISGGTNPNRPLIWMRVDTADHVLLNYRTTSSFRSRTDPTATPVMDNGAHLFIFELDLDAGTYNAWIDNAHIITGSDTTLSLDGFQFTTFASSVALLYTEGSGNSFNGKLIDWRWNNTAFNDAERAALYAPETRFDLYTPIRRRNYFVPAGGGEPTVVNGAAVLAGAGDLDGVPSITSFAAAALVGTGNLSGVPSITAFAEAALAGAGTLDGVPSITVPGAGELAGLGDLSGTGTLVSPGAAVLSGVGDLAGVPSITSPAEAVLSGNGDLSGTPSVTVFGQAVLSGNGNLSGTPSGVELSGLELDANRVAAHRQIRPQHDY